MKRTILKRLTGNVFLVGLKLLNNCDDSPIYFVFLYSFKLLI